MSVGLEPLLIFSLPEAKVYGLSFRPEFVKCGGFATDGESILDSSSKAAIVDGV